MGNKRIKLESIREIPVSSTQVYPGQVLDIYLDHVQLPNGEIAKREVIRNCHASVILAFNEKGEILVEDQYRYPFDKIITELPAGKGVEGEAPKITAAREFEEETGYKATHLELLGLFSPSVGYSDEVMHIYLATGLIKTEQKLDAEEFLRCYFTPFEKFCNRIKNNDIIDGKTIAAIGYYLLKYKTIQKKKKE